MAHRHADVALCSHGIQLLTTVILKVLRVQWAFLVKVTQQAHNKLRICHLWVSRMEVPDTFKVLSSVCHTLLPAAVQILESLSEFCLGNASEHHVDGILQLLQILEPVPPQNLLDSWEEPKI